MTSSSSSARRILADHLIEASAPCRIDSGGTWDIKALALPMERIRPVTVNIALSLRTWVRLTSFEDGLVKVSSEGFPQGEQYPQENTPFDSPFGLFFAAISYFGFHGLHVHIRSDSPLKAALGGSSSALIALLKALSKLSVMFGQKPLSRGEILYLGYHLEDGVSGGNCGIQDQATAVYGGVNQWVWRYGTRRLPFEREPLLDKRGLEELSRRILVAYSGKSHVSMDINRSWINDFLSGATRAGWLKVNRIVCRLATALREEDWKNAAALLKAEMAIRREITPDALIPLTEKLIDQAESSKCGARFTGAGAGGAIWALGEMDSIERLRRVWQRTLAPIKGARILDCVIDRFGVR